MFDNDTRDIDTRDRDTRDRDTRDRDPRDRDALITWFVSDVLRVRPEWVTREARALLRAGAPIGPRLYARWRVRAALSGIPVGMQADRASALVAAGLEHLAWLRRETTIRAIQAYARDQAFFERPDWACVAIGLAPDGSVTPLAVRSVSRFVLRTSIVRGAHAAPSLLGRGAARVLGPIAGASASVTMNLLELRRTCGVERAREAREPRPAPSPAAP